MNLIEELGLEKCKGIVDGAPDGAELFNKFYIRNVHSEGYIDHFAQWNGCKWQQAQAHREFVDEAVSLKAIRTAVDHHYYGQSESEELEQYALLSKEKIEGGAVLLGDFTVAREQLQTELNNCSEKDSSEISITDDCTDIRNHISPNTKVIER